MDNITLRPADADDEPFLLSLYASTRSELDLLAWEEEQKRQFAAMQFNYQCQQYRATYPAADHSIVQKGQEPIGRLIVNRDEVNLCSSTFLFSPFTGSRESVRN